MPESAKGQNKSYKDYIMGTGYDHVEKTPEWAAPITGINAEKIKELAHEAGTAKPLFVVQGWGPQRRSNGELNCWSIIMLPLLTGQIGLPAPTPARARALIRSASSPSRRARTPSRHPSPCSCSPMLSTTEPR